MTAGSHKVILLTSLTFALLLAACSQSSYSDPSGGALPPTPDGPGQQDWSDTNVSCKVQSDCAVHESCVNSICQMARCTDGPYASTPPMGTDHYFYFDKEILSNDSNAYQGDYYIDGYSPQASSIQYSQKSWNFGASKILDVAGGNVEGTRPEVAVTVVQGSNAVHIWNQGEVQTLDVGFQPIAVATGDVDHDSQDEIIALSADGKFALCHAATSTCQSWQMPGSIQGEDVAAADVDGDGYAEGIFLVKDSGKTKIMVWNPNYKTTGEDELDSYDPGTDYLAIDAGDLDGDHKAEIVGLQDGGWYNLKDDHAQIWDWSPKSLNQVGNVAVNGHSRDITVADLDADQHDELVVLHDTKTVDVYKNNGGPGSLTKVYSGDLSVDSSPQRIAAADIDGDSPSATLLKGPTLVPGPVVPTMVLNFPPYSKSHSDGKSYLFVGDTKNTTKAFTDSVSLRLGIEIGVSGGIEGIFQGSLKTSLSRQFNVSTTNSTTNTVGDRFMINPDPTLHGTSYGVVVLASGCFHAYTYQLSDPTGRLGQGADGGKFVVMDPVGGESTIWSSQRYNAMAKAVGNLPIVHISTQLGDPSSYPISPTQGDGTPVAPQDMLFPQPPKYLVSDVGTVGWWLAVAKSTTNEADLNTEIGVSSSLNAAGIDIGGSITTGFGKGYAITVGTEALFGGGVPPIPDDPNTPEDEYKNYAFAFSPLVYMEHYKNSAGKDSAYYVLNYTVGQQQ